MTDRQNADDDPRETPDRPATDARPREVPATGNDPATRRSIPGPDPVDPDPATDDDAGELPEETLEEAERLTRRAREAADESEREAYLDERGDLLDEHGFTARVRRDDGADVLVLYPDEWVDEGTVRRDRIDDVDRAHEVQLSGVGDPDDWAAIDEHNRELAERVRENHGDVHGSNAEAFADFVSNHYAKRIEDTTGPEVREFVEEYFPRNAWPSDEQRVKVAQSIELVFAAADEPVPDV